MTKFEDISRMPAAMLRMAAVFCVLMTAQGYKYFQSRIPNAGSVPHPCKPNFLWEGVGHRNVAGGGARNPFGLDFAENGLKWDSCLCERDSDGDGKSNGEELGDPDCVWSEGGIPARMTSLSHPGVCEPLDSPECIARNDWSFCEYGEFICEATNDTDVQEVKLVFPTTPVPAKVTSYWCMYFDLSDYPNIDVSRDYHLIAAKPLIDNRNVMHHIITAGCVGIDLDVPPASPFECGMVVRSCVHFVSMWTLGLDGECLGDEYGFRMGRTGFKRLVMQFHWNNPTQFEGFTDSSGMALYLTPHLRANDAAILRVGPLSLNIPPGVKSYSEVGDCHAQCTAHLPHSLYLTDALLHMHYLGRSALLEHTRDGAVREIVSEPDFSYDSPKLTTFSDPIEFQPGDEMRMVCNFDSTSRTRMTYYGDATSDEMCFAFITYYPARHDFTACTAYLSLDWCENEVGGMITHYPTAGCNHTVFFNPATLNPMLRQVEKACAGNGSCPDGCQDAVQLVQDEEPCLQGDVGILTELQLIPRLVGDRGRDWVALIHSCEPDWDPGLVYKDQRAALDDVPQHGDGQFHDLDRSHGHSDKCVFDVGSASNLNIRESVFLIMASVFVRNV